MVALIEWFMGVHKPFWGSAIKIMAQFGKRVQEKEAVKLTGQLNKATLCINAAFRDQLFPILFLHHLFFSVCTFEHKLASLLTSQFH